MSYRVADPQVTAELKSSAERLLQRKSDSVAVRAAIDSPAGFDESLWPAVAKLGWLAIPVPEELDGAGATFTDLGVLLVALGGHFTPLPFASAVLGISALTRSSNGELRDRLLGPLMGGEQRAVVAVTARSGDVNRLDVKATATGAGRFLMSGASGFVADAASASHLLVAADGPEGPLLVAVDVAAPGVKVEPVQVMDRTRQLATVTLTDVEVSTADVLTDHTEGSVLSWVVAAGAAMSMADAFGAAEAALARTVAYGKERFQFGRPIGSFQAVKHKAADMALRVATSRAAVDAALRALDGPGALAPAAASVAKAYVGPSAIEVCSQAIQLHGGIGYTWEHDAHFFLKRARLDDALFGSARWHRRELMAPLLSG